MSDHREAVQDQLGEIRPGPGNAAEENDTILVGDRRHRIDDHRGWRLAQKTGECRQGFSPPHAAERAGSGVAHLAGRVVGEFEQPRCERQLLPDTGAGGRAHASVRSGQELEQGRRRQPCTEPSRDLDRMCSVGPLDDVIHDHGGRSARRR